MSQVMQYLYVNFALCCIHEALSLCGSTSSPHMFPVPFSLQVAGNPYVTTP